LYGQLLEALGNLETGLAMKLKALERDPFSPLVNLQIAMSYFHQRQYDQAIAWANKTLELDPQHLLGREILAGAYWKKGDFDRHMTETLKHAESYGVPSHVLEPLKRAYAASGRPGAVRYILQRSSAAPAMS
jgi:tetratricopeptide (TPR) repeat protein